MTRHIGFAVSAMVLLTAGSAGAQGKLRACALLTVEEVSSVVGAPSERPGEHDEVIEDGAWKGETHRRCNWPLGQDGRKGHAYLLVTAMRTDAQRKASTEVLDKPMGEFKALGWAVAKKSVGTAACIVAVPPPSEKTVTVAVTCVMEARGNALSMSAVLTAATVTPEQLKALLDKAASRLS